MISGLEGVGWKRNGVLSEKDTKKPETWNA
jgi:hypothetical protein